MSDISETFYTVIGCMDGRIQEPVAEFGRKKFGAQYPDTITEAGLVGILSKLKVEEKIFESIKFKSAVVSVGKHHSRGIVVSGHQECAGNPVDDEIQKDQILKSAEFIKKIIPDLPVVPVFVVRKNGGWEVEEL